MSGKSAKAKRKSLARQKLMDDYIRYQENMRKYARTKLYNAMQKAYKEI